MTIHLSMAAFSHAWRLLYGLPVVMNPLSSNLLLLTLAGPFTFPTRTSVEDQGCMIIDFQDLISSPNLSGHPNLSKDLHDKPDSFINCLCVAAYQVVHDELGGESLLSENKLPYTDFKLQCRLVNTGIVSTLKQVKANYYGKFISIRGTVVRVGGVRPLCVQMAYQCNLCSHVQSGKWKNGKYRIPSKCKGHDCRGKSFTPLRSHQLTCTVDYQNIRIQEEMREESREPGRMPRNIDCELTRDLVDTCVPGDIVVLSGVVRVTGSTEEFQSKQKDQCLFLLYIEVNSIINSHRNNNNNDKNNNNNESMNNEHFKREILDGDLTRNYSEEGQGKLRMEFSMNDLYNIEEVHARHQLFKVIVGSLCPSIYGHEMVKAGLVLSLFGGGQRTYDEENGVPIRGDIHILIVGDPGLGKSQMLQCISSLAPRCVYVCANSTTASGLTVTLSKEGGGENVLEAGALVLADQGCCCIDEFDKLGNNHYSLLEAMEQQCISIAKAGIVCSLPTRTSIIAAANPSGGHYNKAKTVAENIRMAGPLLSRFDLVFILLDRPDEEMDSRLSEHVMSLHAGRSNAGTPASKLSKLSGVGSRMGGGGEDMRPLSERLKVARHESLDPIPSPLLKKYIGYAKLFAHPKLTKEAAQVLQDFYIELRRKHHTADSTPITTRQLESLVRLTVARARVELREEATEQDAMEVVEMMKYSMIDTYSDDLGMLDFQRSQHGSGSSSRSQAKKFLNLLQKSASVNNNYHFNVQELKEIMKAGGLAVRDFDTFISSLNDQGFLLKKAPRIFQLQISDY